MDKQTLKDALDTLREQGRVYVKAADVAEVVDVEATQGKKTHISQLLDELESVEKWGRSKSLTWHLKERDY